MANLSKIRREKMLEYLEKLKTIKNDDEHISAITEIENALNEKNMVLYGKNTLKKSMKCWNIIFQFSLKMWKEKSK